MPTLNPNDTNSWISLLSGGDGMHTGGPMHLPDPANGGSQMPQDLSNLFSGSGLIDNLYGNKGNPTDPYMKEGLNDAGGRYPGNIAGIRLAPAEYYNLANQYGFYNSLQPEEHQALYRMINYMMNPELMAQQYQQQVQGQTTQQAPQLLNQVLAAGGSQGDKEGVMLNAANNANRESAGYNANLFSPQGTADRANTINSIYNQASPSWNNMSQIAGITTNTPRNQTGLEVGANLLGSVASGAGAKLGSQI